MQCDIMSEVVCQNIDAKSKTNIFEDHQSQFQ